ncbi:MAG: hypothetical protein ACRCUY_06400 [Thermoguttaceae bacterium]
MQISKKSRQKMMSLLFVVVATLLLAAPGCAVYSNGMTLPNPYYLKNHVQYFPKGSAFPYENEAAQLQSGQAEHSGQY